MTRHSGPVGAVRPRTAPGPAARRSPCRLPDLDAPELAHLHEELLGVAQASRSKLQRSLLRGDAAQRSGRCELQFAFQELHVLLAEAGAGRRLCSGGRVSGTKLATRPREILPVQFNDRVRLAATASVA